MESSKTEKWNKIPITLSLSPYLKHGILSINRHPCMASPSFPSPICFKAHSASHVSFLTPQARKVVDRIPHREHTQERKPLKSEKNQRNGGFRGDGEMGHPLLSSTRSRNGKEEDRSSQKLVKRSEKSEAGSVGFELRIKLDMCSKSGDVMGAILWYDLVSKEGLKLEQYHYNVLLYLCSSAATGVIHKAKSGRSGVRSTSTLSKDDDSVMQTKLGSTNETGESDEKNGSSNVIHVSEDVREYARSRGFEIYERMCLEKVPMSEPALTSVARMAMSLGNGDMAFEMVKQMKELGITLRLRSYSPAILAFCKNDDVDKAFEVERHMSESGVYPEEPELEALLGVSVRTRRNEKVYYILHKLRTNVRQVSPSIADLIEIWFRSSIASRVGKRKWDGKMVEQAMVNSGGGWHGLGWLGKGKWMVTRAYVDDNGVCGGCGEKLVTVDLDPIETENFARSVTSIASKRDRSSSFQQFQRWLDYYGPFEAVVDASNVGLFCQRQFSLTKVNAVVNAIRQKLPSKKWPLIIVHNRRLIGRKMFEPLNEKLLEKWKNADAIYATPTGSNDDWYWLYAAIKCKCLIVTNDEMRDHLFQILGNDFFPKWKERHQVHFSLEDGNFKFHMPPPCSVVIQESEKGHWHIPITEVHESGKDRTWLCVTRASPLMTMQHSSIQHKKEAHSQMTTNVASDVGASNQASLPSYNDYVPECHSSDGQQNEKMNTSPQRYIANLRLPKSYTLISKIKAAEKLSGCVIDFQI